MTDWSNRFMPLLLASSTDCGYKNITIQIDWILKNRTHKSCHSKLEFLLFPFILIHKGRFYYYYYYLQMDTEMKFTQIINSSPSTSSPGTSWLFPIEMRETCCRKLGQIQNRNRWGSCNAINHRRSIWKSKCSVIAQILSEISVINWRIGKDTWLIRRGGLVRFSGKCGLE